MLMATRWETSSCTRLLRVWRDMSELLKEADALSYNAKAAGKDAVRFQSASRAGF